MTDSAPARIRGLITALRAAAIFRMAAPSRRRRLGLPGCLPLIVTAVWIPAIVRSPLEFRDRAQDLQSEFPLRAAGVDRIAQRLEVNALAVQRLDHREQVGERPGQAVDPDDDQGIAFPDTTQHGLQLRAIAIGTGRVLAEDFGAAELLKIQDLPLGGLVLRTHSGVADDGYDPLPFFAALPPSIADLAAFLSFAVADNRPHEGRFTALERLRTSDPS